MKGNVVRKINNRGFGFILGEDGQDYFLHTSKLLYCLWEDIEEGDAVVFEGKEQNGKCVAYRVEKYYGDLEENGKIDVDEKLIRVYILWLILPPFLKKRETLSKH